MFKLQHYYLLRKSELQKYTCRNKIRLETTWSVTESFATPKFIMTMYRTKYKILPANPERNASSGTPFPRNPVKDTQPFFLTRILHFFVYYWEKMQDERNWHHYSFHNSLKEIKSHQLLLNFRIFPVELPFQHEKLL